MTFVRYFNAEFNGCLNVQGRQQNQALTKIRTKIELVLLRPQSVKSSTAAKRVSRDCQLLKHSDRAHACRAKLSKSWVRLPLDAGLFFSFYLSLSDGGATLMIFPHKNRYLAVLLGVKQIMPKKSQETSASVIKITKASVVSYSCTCIMRKSLY